MITTRIAINGLGRIGRAFLKIALERPELELVAANDISESPSGCPCKLLHEWYAR